LTSSTLGSVHVSLELRRAEDYGWLRDVLQSAHQSATRGAGDDELQGIKVVPILFTLGEFSALPHFAYFEQISSSHPDDFSSHCAFGSKGVNEMQSIANSAGSTQIQTDINRAGVGALRRYHQAALAADGAGEVGGTAGESTNTATLRTALPRLLEALEILVEDEAREKRKAVDLLLASGVCARLMGAARTTSCKSAKDRTSVYHTLEVARILEGAGWLGK